MKLAEMKHHHDNCRCLPQSSASGRHSLACDCDHRSAMKEISREQSLVTQLRAIVLPALQQADERYELVAQMFQSILDCSSKAMAELQRHQSDDDAQPNDVLVDDKKRVKRSISVDSIRKEDDAVKPRHQQLKRGYACILQHQLMSKTTAFLFVHSASVYVLCEHGIKLSIDFDSFICKQI